MSLTIDPRFMTAQHWTAQTTLLIVSAGSIPKLQNEADWRKWAAQVTALPAIAALGPPRPEPFRSWDAWARQFNLTLQLFVPA